MAPLPENVKALEINGLAKSPTSHSHGETQNHAPGGVQVAAIVPDKSRLLLLAFCFLGIMTCFTVSGMALEQLTSVHAIRENSLTLVASSVSAVAAILLKRAAREPVSTLPRRHYVLLSVLAFISTLASVCALRYVTFITRILGKSCKSIPVMFIGVCFGKRYSVQKYLSVILLSIGVAVFLMGSYHRHTEDPTTSEAQSAIGLCLLLLSLLCDGATGALEDKFMAQYTVGAFELMFQLSSFKALFACGGVVFAGEWPQLLESVAASVGPLLALSLSGAAGQAFIFYTITKFGALTTSIIGTMRKVVSIALSVVLFHHVLGIGQVTGLFIAFTAIMMNWVRCSAQKNARPSEALLLETAEIDEEAQSEVEDLKSIQEQAKARQVLVAWEQTTAKSVIAAVQIIPT
ncbi:hypothetical protein Ae201684P_019047 [Aphanomyces euteiches]|uniref:Sugar phosphate transporter domain-containing protein n=1 Tax=Aphanomyces euteiches TaxID=100861 RepID=A0A6G0XVM3_9STRA|nr:hypothetical protein Ae201684_001180 [Aphanomyces euteiches]KAH9100044.1 hypothetical protein Ae201684P_019047 [Aphanomyces euteiches]KAH9156250.1 hypothetical protein AeRB84_001833 [Aphanomyces euteiches]